MEPKPSFIMDSPDVAELQGGGGESNEDITEYEVEKERIISNEELQYLVEKLHRFAKLQIAKLNHETGVVNDNINR